MDDKTVVQLQGVQDHAPRTQIPDLHVHHTTAQQQSLHHLWRLTNLAGKSHPTEGEEALFRRQGVHLEHPSLLRQQDLILVLTVQNDHFLGAGHTGITILPLRVSPDEPALALWLIHHLDDGEAGLAGEDNHSPSPAIL